MREVNKAVRKKDAMELLLGKPVYTDDIAPKDCLVKLCARRMRMRSSKKSIRTRRCSFRELKRSIHGRTLIRTRSVLPVRDRLIRR